MQWFVAGCERPCLPCVQVQRATMGEDGRMSNLGPMSGQRQMAVPTPPKGEPIARYETYLEAQRAVDYLSDNQFPVQFVTIVGSGLRMVERVTGRLTYPRVAVAGAASGAWFGLFVGLLLTLFGTSFQAAPVVAAVLIGAAFGMMFGVISYSLTGGRRDFTSTSQIVASEYEVLCLTEHAGAARAMLVKLPGGAGRFGPPPSGSPSPWGSSPGDPHSPSHQTPPPSYQGSPYQGTPYQGSPYPTGPQATSAPPTGPYPVAAESGAPQEPPAPVTGPTYGEMVAKAKREREEKARLERESGNPGS
jgi:hypothetical protein